MKLLLASILMAMLIMALKLQPPQSLKPYLWAQLVYIPAIWGANWLWGTWSRPYAVVYTVFTSLILLSILVIVWDCLKDRLYRGRAVAISALVASVMARTAYLGMVHDEYLWISVAEGFMLVFAGLLVGFLAPYTAKTGLALTLGLFWLGQAAYSFGWVLHGRLWDKWNWVVPPAMGCIAFWFIAALLYQYQRTNSRLGPRQPLPLGSKAFPA